MVINKFALQMQEELVGEIESAQPKFIVFVKINYSWGKRFDAYKILYPWLQEYNSKYYTLVGLVDYVDAKPLYHRVLNRTGNRNQIIGFQYWNRMIKLVLFARQPLKARPPAKLAFCKRER